MAACSTAGSDASPITASAAPSASSAALPPGVARRALTCAPAPRRIFDAGCGTGYLLGQIAARAPGAEVLAGIDAAPAMLEAARAAAADGRLRLAAGTAGRLPWPAASFDLVVSTTSFDHWADQRAGLAECARVLAPGGCLVLADLFSALLLPTLLADVGNAP